MVKIKIYNVILKRIVKYNIVQIVFQSAEDIRSEGRWSDELELVIVLSLLLPPFEESSERRQVD